MAAIHEHDHANVQPGAVLSGNQSLSGRWIGVDARDLAGQGTGIATYARGVLQAVAAQGGRSELLLGAERRHAWPVRALRAGLAGLVPPGTGIRDAVPDPEAPASRLRLGRDLFRLAQTCFDLRGRVLTCRGDALPDLMHWTSPLPIRLAGVPNLYTFHDAIPLRRPNRTGTDPARYRRLLAAVMAGADHVVAVSEASRRELEAELPDIAGRVTAIPQAVRLPILSPQPAWPAEWGEYYLYAGSIEPRKNVSALIGAFLASGSVRRLLLAGPDGWRAEAELAPHRDRIGPPEGAAPVARLGFADRDRLLRLVRGARALLYPSLGEGFGLPILEAMGLGTPVLTSAGGATGEVAGDAALLVDPECPRSIAGGIMRLDRDDALCAELRERGLDRVTAFAPDKYARRLAELYDEMMRRRPARAGRRG